MWNLAEPDRGDGESVAGPARREGLRRRERRRSLSLGGRRMGGRGEAGDAAAAAAVRLTWTPGSRGGV
jgi:hypothetical protein